MIRKVCDECGGRLVKKNIDVISHGINLGKFTAEVCAKCGERCFDEKTFNKIELASKQKGTWGWARKAKLALEN